MVTVTVSAPGSMWQCGALIGPDALKQQNRQRLAGFRDPHDAWRHVDPFGREGVHQAFRYSRLIPSTAGSAAGGEKLVQQRVGSHRLQHFDGGAAGERLDGPPKGRGRPVLVGHPAEHGDEGRWSLRDLRERDGDMIETDRRHRRPIHINRRPPCIGWAPSHIPMAGGTSDEQRDPVASAPR